MNDGQFHMAEYITVSDASNLLDRSNSLIQRYCRQGRMRYVTKGGQYFILYQDLDLIKGLRRGPKVKRKVSVDNSSRPDTIVVE